jgi:hypothetical protein
MTEPNEIKMSYPRMHVDMTIYSVDPAPTFGELSAQFGRALKVSGLDDFTMVATEVVQTGGEPCPADAEPAQAVAVSALDAIDASDPERAHDQADEILLSLVSPEVRAAYKRLSEDRASWWAGA